MAGVDEVEAVLVHVQHAHHQGGEHAAGVVLAFNMLVAILLAHAGDVFKLGQYGEWAIELQMLYLLTIADAMATGPKAWNEWTSSLLRGLFLKALNVLEKGELVSRKATRTIDQKKAHVLSTAMNAEQRDIRESILRVMSPRYLLYTPSREIPEHINLYRQMEPNDFVWRIEKSTEADMRTVTICAKDRPGLLSRIAGTFTLNSINILDMHIFTWRNNIALDIFEVEAPPDQLFEQERWDKAGRQLEAALSDELDLKHALTQKQNGFKSIRPITKNRPQKVSIDNQTSSFFTIIEVTAWDFPGLLFLITDALFRCQLDIWVAKVATRVDQVVDVFYVRDINGEKVDQPEQEALIEKSIEAVLT